MAHFALLWKARTIEQYRLDYEREKINSLMLANARTPKKSLFQRLSNCRYDVQKRMTKTFSRWCPEGSAVSNFLICLRTDQTFPNFVLKSVIGFVGGIVMTYLCFMFFVFQLAISLMHATIMSSIIGVLLTLGLAFSYRVRCLVFLLIPQLFSRVGRYTLTCYALVLILTGPATNTLKNSEVLSESMACSQEQLKDNVRQINEALEKPYNSMKDAIKIMIDRVRSVAESLTKTLLKINRMALSIVSVMQSSIAWLNSVVEKCNRKIGSPYDICLQAIDKGIEDCQTKLAYFHWLCNKERFEKITCSSVESMRGICPVVEGRPTLMATVKRNVQTFTERVKTMLHVSVQVHQSYSYSSNTSRSASQVAAGIVTEIRSRADPLLTWLSWSSCVTSLSLLLIIFRAKYYQNMFETRSRFDNRYVTKDLRELDLKRMREGRETVLPLNSRERARYVTTTSFRLVAPEKLYLTRSVVFMTITTFKLLIHIVADYSLFWVLTTIRYHGRFQSSMPPGPPNAGIQVLGNGTVAGIIRSIVNALGAPLMMPAPAPVSCLPNPYPPDLQRYTQIGMLILMLWFFSLFEPYGLRLRHVIMGLYRPERSKARAVWLYNHIIRTRSGFLKFARRKLHKDYKYCSEGKLTLRQWAATHAPISWFSWLFRKHLECLLCGSNELDDTHIQFTRCKSPGCPGIYCECCFNDIGELCTICLSPADYGDLSDVSLEKGSSDDDEDSSSDDGSDTDDDASSNLRFDNNSCEFTPENNESRYSSPNSSKTSKYFLMKQKDQCEEQMPLMRKVRKTPKYGEMQSGESIGKDKCTSMKCHCYELSRRTTQESNYSLSNEQLDSSENSSPGREIENNESETSAECSGKRGMTKEKDKRRDKNIVMLLQKCSSNMLRSFYKKKRTKLLLQKTNRSMYIIKKVHKRLRKVINRNDSQRNRKRRRSYKTLKSFTQKSRSHEITFGTLFEKKLDKTRVETVAGEDLTSEQVNMKILQIDNIAETLNTSNIVCKPKTKHLSTLTKIFKLFQKRSLLLDAKNNHKRREKGDKDTIHLQNNYKDANMKFNGKSQPGNLNESQLEVRVNTVLQETNWVKRQFKNNFFHKEASKGKIKDEASFQDFDSNGQNRLSHTVPSQTSIDSEMVSTGFVNHKNKHGQDNDCPKITETSTKPANTMQTSFKKTCSLILKKSSLICDSTSTGSDMKEACKTKTTSSQMSSSKYSEETVLCKKMTSDSCTCANQQIISLRSLQRNLNKKLDIEQQSHYDKDRSMNYSGYTNGSTSTYYLNYNSVEFVNERKKDVDFADKITEMSFGSLGTHNVSSEDWWSPVIDDRKNGCQETKSYNPIKVQFATKRLVSFKSTPTIIDTENPRMLDLPWTSTPRSTNNKRNLAETTS